MPQMTLEEKIGQMLCFGWSGTTDEENQTYSSHARALIEDLKVGGVILFNRNLQPPYKESAETINQLQESSKIPLFVVTDQEGGMVARFRAPMTVFPGNMAIGATGSEDYARRAASAAAEELKAVGVNFDLAPSVDVNNNPNNPIIGVRSFGESPELVSRLGTAAIRGYQQAGVIACAKHFPGHGDTAVDSHLELPSVPYDKDRLHSIELAPFKAAIVAGVDSIMTTHIIFPAYDPNLPATLSKPIITGLLREELGFDGVVTTDCMEMKAIADNFGTGEAAVLAVLAGVDILLACHTLSRQIEIRDAIFSAVQNGRISASRIDESVERILKLKSKYNLESRRSVDPNCIESKLGTIEHLSLQQEIADKSITLVRDRDSIVPVSIAETSRIVVAGIHRSVAELAESIRAYHSNVETMQIDAANVENDAIRASQADLAILVSCPTEPWAKPIDVEAQNKLIKQVYASGTPTIVVAVREPYDLRHFSEIGTYIATYGYQKAQLNAVAKMIFGKIEPTGKLPVTFPL